MEEQTTTPKVFVLSCETLLKDFCSAIKDFNLVRITPQDTAYSFFKLKGEKFLYDFCSDYRDISDCVRLSDGKFLHSVKINMGATDESHERKDAIFDIINNNDISKNDRRRNVVMYDELFNKIFDEHLERWREDEDHIIQIVNRDIEFGEFVPGFRKGFTRLNELCVSVITDSNADTISFFEDSFASTLVSMYEKKFEEDLSNSIKDTVLNVEVNGNIAVVKSTSKIDGEATNEIVFAKYKASDIVANLDKIETEFRNSGLTIIENYEGNIQHVKDFLEKALIEENIFSIEADPFEWKEKLRNVLMSEKNIFQVLGNSLNENKPINAVMFNPLFSGDFESDNNNILIIKDIFGRKEYETLNNFDADDIVYVIGFKFASDIEISVGRNGRNYSEIFKEIFSNKSITNSIYKLSTAESFNMDYMNNNITVSGYDLPFVSSTLVDYVANYSRND